MIVFDPDFDGLQSGERSGGHESFDALQVISEHLQGLRALLVLRAAFEPATVQVSEQKRGVLA